MKNAIVLSLAALALVACGSKEEVAAPAEAPVVVEATEAEAAPVEAVATEEAAQAAEAAPAAQ